MKCNYYLVCGWFVEDDGKKDDKGSKKPQDDKRPKVKPRTVWDKPQIVNEKDKTFTLQWKPSGVPEYAAQLPLWYIVEMREPPSNEWMRVASDVKETSLEITATSRKKDFYYRIKAANEIGTSEPSMPTLLRKKEGQCL